MEFIVKIDDNPKECHTLSFYMMIGVSDIVEVEDDVHEMFGLFEVSSTTGGPARL